MQDTSNLDAYDGLFLALSQLQLYDVYWGFSDTITVWYVLTMK